MDSPEVSGEWVFGLDKILDENYNLTSFKGPQRALLLTKVGHLEQAVERLQNAVEAPAITANLFASPNRRTSNITMKLVHRERHKHTQAYLKAVSPFRQDIYGLSSKAIELAHELENCAV